MKRFFKKSLICILITLLVFNFCLNPFQVVYAGDVLDAIEGVFDGLVGLLTWVPRATIIATIAGIHAMISSIGSIGSETDFDLITPFDIFFNEVAVTDVNFFDLESGKADGPIRTFRIAVAGWYYTIRTIAAMILLVVLVYIGIRMTLSTIASERAMYKKMLVDWVTSIALLFFLHYIMIFILMINSALVDAMAKLGKSAGVDKFLEQLVWEGLGIKATTSFAAIIVYAVIVIQTLIFLLSYIKRMLNVGFLIIISPLITITYSIDKIGDGKAQALNSWLKEFIYGILIQPFHCILYLAYAKTAIDLLAGKGADNSGMACGVFAILCLSYIKTGEELIKKIFGFGEAQSAAGMAAGAAMTMTALNHASSAGQKLGKGAAGLSRSLGKNAKVKDIKNKLGESVRNSRDAKAAAKDWAKSHNKSKSEEKEKRKEYKNTLKSSNTETEEQRNIRNIAANVRKAQGIGENDKAIVRGFKSLGNKVKGTAPGRFVSKAGQGVKNAAEKVGNTKAGKIGKWAAGIPVGLAKDAGKWAAKNPHKIAGEFAGDIMGLAVGVATGDLASGYAVRSGIKGFHEGFHQNSTATLKKDGEALAKAVSGITGENGKDTLARVLATGDGSGYKDMNKRIDELIKTLKRMGVDEKQARRTVGAIQSEAISNPGNLNQNFINNLVDNGEESFKGLNSEDKEKAKALLGGQAQISAESQLYNNLQNMRNMGMDLNDMTYIAGSFDAPKGAGMATMTPDSIDLPPETHFEEREVDYSNVGATVLAAAVAMNTISDAVKSKDSVDKADIEVTNQKIDALNQLIQRYENMSRTEQNQIITAINSNSGALNSLNQAIDSSGNLTRDNFSDNMSKYVQELQNTVKNANATSSSTNE